MQITVFGASGKVGRLVVEELLARHNTVVAFVHNSTPFMANDKLKVITGSVYDTATVAAAIAGSDAVISALGSWGTPSKDVLSVAMTNIIPVMHACGVKRIVSLTGHDARVVGDSIGLAHRLSHVLLGVVAGKILYDGENHIRLLAQTSLEWTVLRSPIMTAQNNKTYGLGAYRPLPWATIPRLAVAKAVADQIGTTDYLQQSPFIANQYQRA